MNDITGDRAAAGLLRAGRTRGRTRTPAVYQWRLGCLDCWRYLPAIDPSNGRGIGRTVEASDADVDRAVAAARAAFDDGRWTGLPPIVRERMD